MHYIAKSLHAPDITPTVHVLVRHLSSVISLGFISWEGFLIDLFWIFMAVGICFHSVTRPE